MFYLLYALKNKVVLSKHAGFIIPNRQSVFYALSMAAIICHVLAYGYYAMTHSYAGTISVKKGRDSLFKGQNNVSVYVNEYEFYGLSNILFTVNKLTETEDFLLCFPFCPGINFMTDRKTYMKGLYFDDGLLRKKNWQNNTIREMKKKKPAIVMYSDMAINKTEISRFSNWAQKICAFLKSEYIFWGKSLDYYIYVHPDVYYQQS